MLIGHYNLIREDRDVLDEFLNFLNFRPINSLITTLNYGVNCLKNASRSLNFMREDCNLLRKFIKC